MKATKKIVGAACALVAAVALSAGTTFAWFATNNSVSASGLQLTVNTASSYLLIGNSTQKNSAANNRAFRTSIETTTTFVAAETELNPVSHGETSLTKDNATTYGASGIWYTDIGTSASDGTGQGTSETKKNIANATGYFLTDTLYVTVKPDSGDSEALKVSGVTVAKPVDDENANASVKPVCVFIICGDNVVEYTHTGSSWTAVGNTTLATKVEDDDEKILTVSVYVYYNGAHADVTTNNATNLVGATVGINLIASNS